MKDEHTMDEWKTGLVVLGLVVVLALAVLGVGLLIGCPKITQTARLVAIIVGFSGVFLATLFFTDRFTSL